MSGVDRIREYIENVTDWSCLEKLRLSKVLVGMLVFDFVMSLGLLCPATMIHFLYVNPAGRAGFVRNIWIEHVDIYRFRRFQPWENYQYVDWEEGDRYYVNETRNILDEKCSNYENEDSIYGDPGDYIREVVGHPNESGYNERLREMIKMFTWGLAIIYFTCPLLLLARWWKKNSLRIIILYINLQLIPMILFVVVTAHSGTDTMCAIDIIYARAPVRIILICFTVFIWLYSLVKFAFLLLYCIEQHLSRKRKDFGFRRRKKNKVAPAEDKKKIQARRSKVEDESKIHKKLEMSASGRKSEAQKRYELEKEGEIQVKKLAREILELGGTTDDDHIPTTDTDAASSSVRSSRVSSSLKNKKVRESQLNKLAKRSSNESIDETIDEE